jgi:hypothetical protein
MHYNLILYILNQSLEVRGWGRVGHDVGLHGDGQIIMGRRAETDIIDTIAV